MRKLILGLLVFFCLQHISAQQSVITGKLSDTLDHKTPVNAVVSLIRAKDSILSDFTRSDKEGNFRLNNVTPGKYLLLITYPRFADFSDEYEIKNIPENNLGTIPLTLKSKLLDAVVIKSAGAIRIKGDTTEFVADSFKIKEGATVEDLLKRLPGFQVNAKGEITAQGQKVQKVLVDGEEFFGDDPTAATQNIGAKYVDKVQVYDTKSEQQQLTGITNNADGKTVNIKLKDNNKKGYFGKLNAGYDFNKYVDVKGIYNNFVGKRKLSAYVTKSNISTGSLNWEDRQKIGLENDIEYDEIGGYYFSTNSNDEFSDWTLRGLPDSYSAGLFFNNKWNDDKQGVNGSYRYNRLRTMNDATTFIQNILQNTVNYRNKYQHSDVLNQQNAANGKYEWKTDSLTSFKFSTAGIYKTSDLAGTNNSAYLNANKEYINTSTQVLQNHTKRTQSDNQLTYKQMFNKKDRLLLTTIRFGYISDQQNGINITHTNFYKNNVIDSVDLIDQMKIFNGNSKTFGFKTVYSEPLSKKLALILDYAYNQNNSTSDRRTYNKSSYGKYEMLDTIYSNNFQLNAFSNSSSAIFRYIDNKFRLSAGSGISSVKLNLFNLYTNTHTAYNFTNLTPQAQVAYTFKPQTRLSFNYKGTTIQPGINQLQPLRDNNDPLNVFIGNPNLKVGFNHSLSAYFNQYKVLKGSGIWLNFNYNIVNNAITNYNIVDTVTGKQTSTPVNVNGNRNWSFWTNFNKGEGEKKLSKGIQFNGNGGRSVNYSNGQKNITDYSTLNAGLSLGYDFPDKYNFYFNPETGYSTTTSSLQPGTRNNYFTYGGNFNGFYMLPGKIELSTDINANLQQKISGFAPGVNIVVWNASIAKKVFKNKSGKFIFLANDILDQNKGFNRIINSNYIQEERYSRISRYFLLKFEWTFSKMPGSK
ncbi:MAG TPA: TonB-dependent receptor [Flavisolibacter sp.]|nr:TonB-dependent receptor [Flavisolibacter sp.]